MEKIFEKQLALALDDAFQHNPVFATWFVDQTKFAGMGRQWMAPAMWQRGGCWI